MKVNGFAPFLVTALLVAGCETTNESEWASAPGGTSFDHAERTCEDQQEFIAEESARTGFFVKCMAAFDWSPEAGSAFADAAAADRQAEAEAASPAS